MVRVHGRGTGKSLARGKKKQQSRTPSQARKRRKLVNPQSNSETCTSPILLIPLSRPSSIPKIVSDLSISPFMLSHVPWWRLSSRVSSSIIVSSTWREKYTSWKRFIHHWIQCGPCWETSSCPNVSIRTNQQLTCLRKITVISRAHFSLGIVKFDTLSNLLLTLDTMYIASCFQRENFSKFHE